MLILFVCCSFSVSLPPMLCGGKLVCANCELSLGLLHRKMCQRIVEFVPFSFAILRCFSFFWLNEISLVLPLSFVVWSQLAFVSDAALNHNCSLVYLTRAMDFGSIVNSASRLLYITNIYELKIDLFRFVSFRLFDHIGLCALPFHARLVLLCYMVLVLFRGGLSKFSIRHYKRLEWSHRFYHIQCHLYTPNDSVQFVLTATLSSILEAVEYVWFRNKQFGTIYFSVHLFIGLCARLISNGGISCSLNHFRPILMCLANISVQMAIVKCILADPSSPSTVIQHFSISHHQPLIISALWPN